MRKLVIFVAFIAVFTASYRAADASEPLSVEVGAVVNQNDDCTLVTFEVTGEYDAYFLYGPDGLWATETKQIQEFRLLGAIYGVPGEQRDITTSDKFAPLGSGFYSLTVVRGADTASASVECGDLEYDIALNTQYEEPKVVHPVIDDSDLVKPKPVEPEPFQDVLRVPYVRLASQPQPI